MTPTRLRECLASLGWTQRGLARLVQRQEGSVRQWARGVVGVPPEVAAWLDALATFHDAHPAPRLPRGLRTLTR